MSMREKIERWKKYPNALGSEAEAAVIVGEVANALREQIPVEVAEALKKLALRGTMRDIASAIGRGEAINPDVPSFHDVVDVGAASAGVSWAEAISVITHHFDAASERIG